MRYPSVKMKARFVLLTMLLGSTLGVFSTSYRGGFFAYGDPSSYEYSDGGATQELAGGMLVLCRDSLEYTRSLLKDLEDEGSPYMTAAWEKLAKAEEQYDVAQIQMFEYKDYHASVQHSRRVLELCEEAVDLASKGRDDGDVLGGGASDYELAWGAIERARTLLNNLEDATSKLSGTDVSVVNSVLDDAKRHIELAETQLTYGELEAAEASVSEAMSLLGQAKDLLQYLSRDKKIVKVLTLIESYEERLRELEGKVVDALTATEDSEASLNYTINIFEDARDKVQQIRNKLDEVDLNLVIDELDAILYDVLDSLSSIGWLNDSDMQPLLFQYSPEEKSNNGNPQNEKEPEPEPEPEEEPEEKSNNGNPQNEKEPEPEPEPEEEPEEKSNNGNPQNEKEPEPEDDDDEDDDDEDSSVIDKLVEKIKKWYDRKKDKMDKDD